MILNTFLYYFCFASAVLIYGLGTTKIINFSNFTSKTLVFFIKLLLSVSVTVIISWLITNKILVPMDMVELYPMVCLFIYVCVNIFTEAIIRITVNLDSAEFIVSFLIVLLTVSESLTIADVFIISGSCILSILFLLPLIYSFRNRIMVEIGMQEKYYCRLFLFMALLIFIISSWDSMWINPEVIK
ncbi:MAG: hypothetical protein K5829_12455 [Treponema sp.]|nr:hypothetical protein [Treponema sp.]